VQQGFRRGDVLVPGQTAHGSSRPDYGVRAAGRRRWVDLKGNVLEGRDRAEVLDLARRNQAQARRARANLPKDDTLTIRYDPLSDLDTKRALLAIHFAANSPVNRVDFGTEAWDLARWHRVFGS
jgi:hypothetical protein